MTRQLEHVTQLGWGYCLPACAQMALSAWDIHIDQRRLATLLGTKPGIGTPFSNLQRLSQVDIAITEWSGLAVLATALAAGNGVITAVITTPGLPSWGNIRTPHTLLVTAITPEHILYHDPALPNGPVQAFKGEFELAWQKWGRKRPFSQKNTPNGKSLE